jgi:Flp pilus assembly protein TadG
MMRTCISKFKQAARSGERGQAVVLFALGLAGLCGFVGLALDVGQLLATKTDLQKTADAAVLAGAQDLPTTTTAQATALAYATTNGVPNATVVFSQTYSANDTIEVTATRHVNYTFLKVLGLSGADVSAKAKARAGSYVGGKGIVPWGLVASNNSNSKLLQNTCFLNNDANGIPQFKQNTQCTLKYGAGTNSGGDFGALTIGQSGAAPYRSNIANGSTTVINQGDKLDSETGGMVGPTAQGVDDRMALPAPQGCAGNARDDVLKTNADGSVTIRPGCEDSPRIIVIPVVDKIQNPQKSTVLGFAFMYLTAVTGGGGSQQVKGEFVKFVNQIPNGVYQGLNGGATAVMLIE